MTILKLPRPLGPLMLIGELGRGVTGTVYRGETTGAKGFRMQAAVKLVDPRKLETMPGLIAALADEAVLLSRLNHPNIVRVYGFEKIDDPVIGRWPPL